MAPSVANSGIVTDIDSGTREIPESVRADGSTRKAIKIRPGFRPAEDVELYRSRHVVARNRQAGIPGATPEPETHRSAYYPSRSAESRSPAPRSPAARSPAPSRPGITGSWRTPTVPGAEAAVPNPTTYTPATTLFSANVKNAKRREARRRASESRAEEEPPKKAQHESELEHEPEPEIDHEKKARGLKKKIKQAQDLKIKQDNGEALLPEQATKVSKIDELIAELDSLGFGTERDVDERPETVDDSKVMNPHSIV